MGQRQTANLVNGLDLEILHETIEAVKQNPAVLSPGDNSRTNSGGYRP